MSLDQLAEMLAERQQVFVKEPDGSLTLSVKAGNFCYEVTVSQTDLLWARALIMIPMQVVEIADFQGLDDLVGHWSRGRLQLAVAREGKEQQLWLYGSLLVTALEPELDYVIETSRTLAPFLLKVGEDGEWKRVANLAFTPSKGLA